MTTTQPRKHLYRRSELTRLLAPKSVVIVGASQRIGSFGERVLRNLGTYEGNVYLVNPNYQTISGIQAYQSIEALPDIPDCAVLTIPREGVEAAVLSCVSKGIGGVVIFASGYGETGSQEDRDLEIRLAEIARDTGLKICGPNCMGFANYADTTLLSFTEFHPASTLMQASIGVVSQSGAMSFCLGDSMAVETSFSHLFSTGNSCDVDVADLVAYLCDDDACRSIICVFEGSEHPTRMLEAARLAWKTNKPLLIHKLARSEQGSAAAVSHTGSLAGSHTAYTAMFESAGAIMVDKFEDLVEMAAFFAKAGKPSAEGVAVISPSGGAAIMAADFAERHDVCLPQPSEQISRRLRQHIPSFGSSRNPCDVTAQVVNNPHSLDECADALISEAQYGVLVLAQTQAYAAAAARVARIGEIALKHGKLACNVMVTQWKDGPGARETSRSEHVALFRSMDRCFHTLSAWHRRERWRAQRMQEQEDFSEHDDRYGDAVTILKESQGTVIGESASKIVLAAYGVPVTQEQLVQDEESAARCADRLGYPVAVKVESPSLPHKTEAGIIRLNLNRAEEVRTAYRAVMRNAEEFSGTLDVTGVLVQEMVPEGLEIMIGARNDPLFGPLIVVGLGGVLVELLSDTVTALAPVSPSHALQMLQQLKAWPLLQGFRGTKPVNVDSLVTAITGVSRLIAEHGKHIQEIDINPLICSRGRIVAVDALIVKRGEPTES